MILKTSYRELQNYSGRDYQRMVGAGVAWSGGPGPKMGQSARELPMDDAFGVIMTDYLVQYGLKTGLAVVHALRIFHELEKLGFLPGQILDQEVEVPCIVIRIHQAKDPKPLYEIRTYDHFPKVQTEQNEERVEVGAYRVRWFPETAMGTSPAGPVYEVEATGLVLQFLNFFREKLSVGRP